MFPAPFASLMEVVDMEDSAGERLYWSFFYQSFKCPVVEQTLKTIADQPTCVILV